MRAFLLCLFLACLMGCAGANGEPSAPDIRISGTWQGGISAEKGFK